MHIPRVAAIQRFDVVGVPHTNQATFVEDDQGCRWVAKREAEMGFEGLMAEAMTWLLAGALGAPVPAAGFCDAPSERAWLSRYVPRTTHWMADVAAVLVDLDAAGAILALDLLILNEARHARNLLVEHLDDGAVRLWAIDGEEAVIGYPVDYLQRLDVLPAVRNHARGLPIDALATGARDAADRATRLEPETIRSFVAEAAALTGSEADGLAEGVLQRGRLLPALMEAYLNALRALS